MKTPLLIFGAGTLARLAFLEAEDSGAHDVVGFVVDANLMAADRFLDRPVHAWSAARASLSPQSMKMHCAIGYRTMRRRAAVFDEVKAAGFGCVSLISPRAHVSRHAELGENCFVMAGAVIEPGARLGPNNMVWSNATVCHDCTIGSHNFIAAGATLGGHVTVGDRSFLGFGSVVRERQRVGNDVLIGAQSLVLDDAEDLHVYLGSPARAVKPVEPAVGVSIE
jgi:sugar O-acyltransferase (sialic acid O-acetyltransferase NeuD family)